MPRKRQADKVTLHIKGEPSAKALPVEIALCLPCMKEVREWIGGSVLVVKDKLIWIQNNPVNNFEEE